jgi:septum formation protein
MQIILASASPRRRELLSTMGIDFQVKIPQVDEEILNGESPCDFCLRVSREKALLIGRENPESLVIAADTIVVIDGKILGKPKYVAQATTFLKTLRARAHDVYTAYTLVCLQKDWIVTRLVKTTVYFKYMTDKEIAWYVSTCEPMDKAGAYALQGLGAIFIDKIDGSYTNVIGLPLSDLYHDLKEHIPCNIA